MKWWQTPEARELAPPPPRVIGKVLGFRAWEMDGHRLTSLNRAGGGWDLGENHAKCLLKEYWEHAIRPLCASQVELDRMFERKLSMAGSHTAPGEECDCGLYAVHDVREVGKFTWFTRPYVIGAVLGWGRVVVHSDGWRAEHAQPVVLSILDERYAERVEAIASEFEVPFVPMNHLERRAFQYGDPVPAELVPPVGVSEAFQAYFANSIFANSITTMSGITFNNGQTWTNGSAEGKDKK